jgi:5-methyltetrahydropteroyltriglutamate--homocysteine methyltransferase
MFETTLAGSLPKPSWLATPNVLWAPWTLTGAPLLEAKDDATALAIRRQEEAGIDIVSDGEQARQHFVHGFLEKVDGGASSCTSARRASPAPPPAASSNSPCPGR